MMFVWLPVLLAALMPMASAEMCGTQGYDPAQYYCLAYNGAGSPARGLCPVSAPCACPTPDALKVGGAAYGCFDASQYHCSATGLVQGPGPNTAGACGGCAFKKSAVCSNSADLLAVTFYQNVCGSTTPGPTSPSGPQCVGCCQCYNVATINNNKNFGITDIAYNATLPTTVKYYTTTDCTGASTTGTREGGSANPRSAPTSDTTSCIAPGQGTDPIYTLYGTTNDANMFNDKVQSIYACPYAS